VRAACHPQDPGTPKGGYRGIDNVLSVPGGKGLFQFLSLHDSPYHGLNLCVGTLSEMLWDPQREVYDIRHPDDPDGRQAFARGYGYLRALMQAVESTL
jgi:D-mannonate dehydratase